MAKFRWEGTTRGGDVRRGVLEAVSEEAVMNRLRADQITPRKVRKQAAEINIKFGSGVKPRDLQVFTRQLATMVDAGLPLVQCLDILSSQSDNPHFGKILVAVKASVESGSNFSDALRKHPKVFDELYCNLIEAGEKGGILDTILNRLGTYIEKAIKLKRQLKGALIYPAAVMVVAAAVVIVMLTYVIPVFENMYKEFKGAELPAPTRFVIRLSNGFASNWYIFFGILVALVVVVGMMARTKQGRLILDRMLLRVPVIGEVLRKIIVARFTRTLGTLLSSGVAILDSLEICAKTSGNQEMIATLLHAERDGPKPAHAPATKQASAGDTVQKLKDLQDLRAKGAITEEEFQKLKKEALGGN